MNDAIACFPSSIFSWLEISVLISLPHYAKIKNRCCIAYYGDNEEIIETIRDSRAQIEQSLPGIKLFMSFADEIVQNDEIPKSKIQELKGQIAYFCEIKEKTDLLSLLV